MGTRGYRRFEWQPILGALLAQAKPRPTTGSPARPDPVAVPLRDVPVHLDCRELTEDTG